MPRSRVLVTATLAVATSLVTVLGVSGPPAANASARTGAGYTYTTMVGPTGQALNCALNNLGQVAVASWSAGNGPTTVVRADGSSVTPIASPLDGLGEDTTGLAINDTGQVAVSTWAFPGDGLIVVGDGSQVRVVARSGPGEVFSRLGYGISLNSRRVAFVGWTPGSVGVYAADGVGPLVTRLVFDAASYNDPKSPVFNAAGQIAIMKQDGDRFYYDSIYRVERDRSISRLAPAPLTTRDGLQLGGMNRAGRVVYNRLSHAIFTVRSAAPTLVASGADGFTKLGFSSINDAGQVAFFGTTPGGIQSIYTGSTPSFTPVVRVGDVINGRKVVQLVDCSSGLFGGAQVAMFNNAGQVAFRAIYQDGTSAILRADPVTRTAQ